MISQINVAGYKINSSTTTAPQRAAPQKGFDGNATDGIGVADGSDVDNASLFGEQGVNVGGEVLRHVVQEIQVCFIEVLSNRAMS